MLKRFEPGSPYGKLGGRPPAFHAIGLGNHCLRGMAACAAANSQSCGCQQGRREECLKSKPNRGWCKRFARQRPGFTIFGP
jgi:hypothetical protein